MLVVDNYGGIWGLSEARITHKLLKQWWITAGACHLLQENCRSLQRGGNILVTWPDNYYPSNDDQVLFTANVGSGNITQGTTYYAKNSSLRTFNISATKGGAAIAFAGGEGASPTANWDDYRRGNAVSSFSHNIYFNHGPNLQDYIYPPPMLSGVISSNPPVGDHYKAGGQLNNCLYLAHADLLITDDREQINPIILQTTYF